MYREEDIAIIGVACRFPEAETLEQFWINLSRGRESVRDFPVKRAEELEQVIGQSLPINFERAGYLEQVTLFEPEIFSLSQEECKFIDPQHRLLLELVEEAILDAGYNPQSLADQNVGVFIADNRMNYAEKMYANAPMTMINKIPASKAGRISYLYNFHGPALSIGTACSSSLVALHYACQELRKGNITYAVCGGTELNLLPEDRANIGGSIFSPEQKVKAFDKKADGTAKGEGGGIVLLRLAREAIAARDQIHGIIKGTGVNSDGRWSNGLMAPSERGQADVLLRALEDAGVEPKTISYIEAHGTGTSIGDPIEIAGITRAFASYACPQQSIAIGSVKTNVGHLNGAAGMAGLIKTVLALKHQQIPPSLNFTEPNPLIELINSPVYVNTQLQDWTQPYPRRAGVTALGLTGTNTHVILEEYVKAEYDYRIANKSHTDAGVRETDIALNQRESAQERKDWREMIHLSARTEKSLHGIIQNLYNFLRLNTGLSLADIAYTLNTGRRSFRQKAIVLAKTQSELVIELEKLLRGFGHLFLRPLNTELTSVFIFPDFEEVDVKRTLLDHRLYYQHYQKCLAELPTLTDLQDPKILYLCHQYAYAKTLQSYSLLPEAIFGFGLGDLVANLVLGESTFVETVSLVKAYDQPQKVIDVSRLDKILEQIISSGINVFCLFSGNNELIELFTNLLQSKTILSFLPLASHLESFEESLITLQRKGLEIDFNKVYVHEANVPCVNVPCVNVPFVNVPCVNSFGNTDNKLQYQRLSLPGYVFDRKSYYQQTDLLNHQRDLTDQALKLEQRSSQNSIQVEHLLHHPVWREEDLDTESFFPTDCKDDQGQTIIFHDLLGIGHKLVEGFYKSQAELIHVYSGKEFTQLDTSHYQLNLENEQDYLELIKLVVAMGRIQRVIHLVNCDSPQSYYPLNSLEKLPDHLKTVNSMFYLGKALGDYPEEIQFYSVTTNAQKILLDDSLVVPEKRMVSALCKVINQEFDQITAFSLDFDLKGMTIDKVSALIYKEIITNTGDILEVGYRKGIRYIQHIDNVVLDQQKQNPLVIRDDGVYLLTGGTGGVALNLIKVFTQYDNVKLILINRNPLRVTDKNYAEKAALLKELTDLGVLYEVINADVADLERMTELIAEIKVKYGRIDGVIHTAGVGRSVLLKNYTPEIFEQVIQAKVQGTVILSQLLQDQFLDFFILCSSLSADVAGLGHTLYAPANAFLDGFSALQRQLGRRFISINWGSWNNTGMSRGSTDQAYCRGLSTLKPEEGRAAFKLILQYNLDHIWVSELNQKICELYQSFGFFKIAGGLKTTSITTLTTHDSSTVEENLYQMLEAVYVGEECRSDYKLYELGFDSIDIMQFFGKIKKTYNVEIPLKLFFEDLTVATLITEIKKLIVGKAPDSDEIQPLDWAEYYPVSSAQKRMFILHQLNPESTSYNLPGAVLITGELDQKRFEQAIKEFVKRHEVLRTSFGLIKEELVQKIHDDLDWVIEYSYLEINAPKSQVDNLICDFIRPFDLTLPPLFRIGLIKWGERHVFIFDMHHLITDGFSREIMVTELIKLYKGEKLAPLRIQYKDYAAWQSKMLLTDKMRKQEEFWLSQFSPEWTGREIPILNLPTDHSRPMRQSFSGAHYSFHIAEERLSGLQSLAKTTHSTLYMTLLAVYTLLLAKYTNQTDIIIGSPSAGRNHEDLENLLGVFVNTIVLRNYPEGIKSFREFLIEVRDRTLATFENQDYQFETLIDKLNLERDLSRNPLFDTMFRLHNHLGIKVNVQHWEDTELSFAPYNFDNPISQFDIQFSCMELADGLGCTLEYCVDLFNIDTIQRMADHFEKLVMEVIAYPDIPMSELSLLTDEEKTRIIKLFNDTKLDYPKDLLIHQLFLKQALKTPEQLALVAGNEVLTYRELNHRANQLAHYLITKGVSRESIIGLLFKRQVQLIIGILGVLKAGGAYLPIDPDYPDERIQYMLTDSGATLVLTESGMLEGIDYPGESVVLHEVETAEYAGSNTPLVNSSQDLIYLIYTSGSTGLPKGTMLEHRSVHNFIMAMSEKFSDANCFLCSTTVSFDIFVLETLLPLCMGAKVVLADELEQQDPALLLRLIEKQRVDLIQVTPSRLQLLLERPEATLILAKLRYLLVGGEAFPIGLLKRIQSMTPAKLYNMYGPTEATVWSTMSELTQAERITIGRPIANTQIYILDSDLNPVPEGIIGDLYIAGDGLARGYYQRDELTEERFIPNPFVSKTRMYKTGDLACWTKSGEIEFKGRSDQQLKIRGYRIEAAEIEHLLNQYPEISESVVVAKTAEDGYQYLAAYYIAVEELTVNQLRKHLLQSLPDYMIPGSFSWLTEFPLTPNGKIDRRALAKLKNSMTNYRKEYLAPQNETEIQLVEIWQEILKIERVGVHDNFFDLGGNSVLMVRLHSRLDELYPARFRIVDLFAYPTVAEFSKYLEETIRESSKKEQIADYWREEIFEKVSLLSIPDSWRNQDRSGEEYSYRFEIRDELLDSLRLIAQDVKVSLHTILSAIYLYLFYEVLDNPEVVIMRDLPDISGEVFPLMINCLEVQDFKEFFDVITIKSQRAKEYYHNSVQSMMRSLLTPSDLLPAMIIKVDTVLTGYDPVLLVEYGSEIIHFEYNSVKIQREQSIELIQSYVSLLELLVENY